MYKIAVLGNRDSIYALAALGLEIFPTDSMEIDEAAHLLKKLASESYAVIYITEEMMEVLKEEMIRYKKEIIPAIIPIPGTSGNTGAGMSELKKLVEQAVGSDIIFNG